MTVAHYHQHYPVLYWKFVYKISNFYIQHGMIWDATKSCYMNVPLLLWQEFWNHHLCVQCQAAIICLQEQKGEVMAAGKYQQERMEEPIVSHTCHQWLFNYYYCHCHSKGKKVLYCRCKTRFSLFEKRIRSRRRKRAVTGFCHITHTMLSVQLYCLLLWIWIQCMQDHISSPQTLIPLLQGYTPLCSFI